MLEQRLFVLCQCFLDGFFERLVGILLEFDHVDERLHAFLPELNYSLFWLLPVLAPPFLDVNCSVNGFGHTAGHVLVIFCEERRGSVLHIEHYLQFLQLLYVSLIDIALGCTLTRTST